MVAASTSALQQGIRRIIDTDPDLSKANILRQLRAEGIRVGNVRGRAAIDVARVARQGGQIAADLFTPLLDFEGYTATIHRIRGGVEVRFRRALGEALRERGGSEETSHVAIDWVAEVDATVTFYGMPHERITERFTGRIVQPIEGYNRDLVEARIAQQVSGRIAARYSSDSGTFVEGLDIRFNRVDVSIADVTPRGRRRNG